MCGSSDANSLYDDGHTYCFSCETYTNNGETVTKQPSNTTIRGEPTQLAKRKLSLETCSKYRIYRDGNYLRFHYFSNDGILLGAKVRSKSKIFTYEGDTDGTFFGQHLFPSTGRRVVITEGELDAASCYEAMPGWPMVSLPTGAAGAKKAVQRNLQWLQGYEEIVLFFDNDEPGRKAAQDCALILPPGKCKITYAPSDYKDASDLLQADEADLIRRCIWDAKPYQPDGIVEAKTLLNLVTSPNPPHDYEYPYGGVQSKLHGIRHGELVTITAGSGIGKSSFCRELACHLLNNGGRVGYVALEESNRRTALGLMSSAIGKSLHIGNPTVDELTEAYEATLSHWPLFLFDGFGSFDPDVVYNRIEYLASGLDCKVIFLDHLSILLSGLEGDERRTIDQTMTRLRSLVERTQIAMFLVCHLSGDDGGTPYEEGGRVKLNKLRGSRSIAQLSDAVIALERDQQTSSDTTVRILKNRYSGEVGVACNLTYDLDTCKFYENQPEPEFNPSTDF